MDFGQAVDTITGFIATEVKNRNADGIVIGLSGGLDSTVAVYLAVRALGPDRVFGLILPDSKVSAKRDISDAKKIAKVLGIKYKVIDIAGAKKNLLVHLPRSRLAQSNLSARLRMSIIYYYASTMGRLVLGTSDKSEVKIGYFCYDKETRALTKDGLKTYDKLNRGDIVFSLDMETGQVRECPVREVYTFYYDGKMFHFNSRALDVMVTPSHRMLVQAGQKRGGARRVQFRTVEECVSRKTTIFPVPKPWHGNTNDVAGTYHLEYRQKDKVKSADVKINDLLYLYGLFICSGWCYCSSKTRVPIAAELDGTLNKSVVQKETTGMLTTLVAKEMMPEKNSQKIFGSHEVLFDLPQESKGRRNLVSILDSYQIDFSADRDLVRVQSREIYSLFGQCGRHARNKKIPEWILQYPSDNLVWLYKGLEDGSREKTNKNKTFCIPLHGMIAGYIELIIKLGRLGTVKTGPKMEKRQEQGRAAVSSQSFEISVTADNMQSRTFDNRNARLVDYKGKIWCPEVPETNNLLVERNGKFIFCGNTKYGDGGADILPIAGLYKTQVRSLARYMGIGFGIAEKKSSPGLWRGQTAEGEIGMPYEEIDTILQVIEKGLDRKGKKWLESDGKAIDEISSETGLDAKKVSGIIEKVKKSWHKQEMPPVCQLK